MEEEIPQTDNIIPTAAGCKSDGEDGLDKSVC